VVDAARDTDHRGERRSGAGGIEDLGERHDGGDTDTDAYDGRQEGQPVGGSEPKVMPRISAARATPTSSVDPVSSSPAMAVPPASTVSGARLAGPTTRAARVRAHPALDQVVEELTFGFNAG
jgi:hypothetical protein